MLRPLEAFLIRDIQEKGPMPLDVFHQHALSHPQYGYYRTQLAVGREGDFVTAPEVSPLFCDVVAALFLHEWETVLKEPPTFSLIELGPGRGTLIAHLLSVARLRPGFQEGAHIALFEINPLLKQLQASKFSPQSTVNWVETLEQLDPLPSPWLILANEFFDTFPIKQWDLSNPARPLERKVGYAEGSFFLTPDSLAEHIQEESQQAKTFWQTLLELFRKKGGMMWVADYGPFTSHRGESWQGLYQGKPSSPLEHIGLTDLSAHVPFDRLVALAEGFSIQGPLSQREFLFQCGIRERLEALKQHATTAEKAQLEAGLMRLTHPLQMGDLFKVLMVRA